MSWSVEFVVEGPVFPAVGKQGCWGPVGLFFAGDGGVKNGKQRKQ